MKKLALTISLAVFLVAAAPADDRSDILAVERAWDTAVVKRDVAALDRILADDFLLVWINGQISGKRDMLQAVAARKAEIDPFETEDVNAGGEAVVHDVINDVVDSVVDSLHHTREHKPGLHHVLI